MSETRYLYLVWRNDILANARVIVAGDDKEAISTYIEGEIIRGTLGPVLKRPYRVIKLANDMYEVHQSATVWEYEGPMLKGAADG